MFLHIWALLAATVFVYPLVWMAAASVKPNWSIYRAPLNLIPDAPTWDAYRELFRTTPFLTYTFNSILYSAAGAIVSIGFGLITAYGFSRHRFGGRKTLMIVILTAQLMPGLIAAIPTYLLMRDTGLLNTRLGLILLYGALSIPFAVWVLKGHFDTIPMELDDSARMDGASRFRTLVQIHLPLLVPGVSSLFLILFVQKWSEFALASILLRDPDKYPLSVGTYLLLGPDESDFRLMAAASLVNIIPILVLFLFLQRFLISGLTKGAVKQ
jgi:ABC-type glycerol-3-phosphate transport system permease component